MSRPPRRLRTWTLLAAAAIAASALAACSDEPEPDEAGADAFVDADEIERLKALGYLDATEEIADPASPSVVRMDPARVEDGYRLYCTKAGALAELIAIDGTPVHRWEDPASRSWTACALLENGDLVVVGVDRTETPGDDPSDAERHIRRLTWDGRDVWRSTVPAHHDVAVLPGDHLLTLAAAYTLDPEIHADAAVRDDHAVWLDADGVLRDQRSLLTAFRSDPARIRILPVEAQFKWSLLQVDLIHANTIAPVEVPDLSDQHPLYGGGNIIVTSRNQDLVAILDWESHQVLWSWGQGEISGPHEGRVLPSGNVLVLDNGVAKQRSRVLEIDPLTDTIVWEYQADPPKDFFTTGRGGAQRLPGGNTLITDSSRARAFEVTPEGDVVWEFLGPHLTADNRRKTFRRMRHYPRAMIDGILRLATAP